MADAGTARTVLIVGTCDTKFEELQYLRDRILEHTGCSTILIDVGRDACIADAIDMSNDTLRRRHEPNLPDPLPALPVVRDEYIRIMAGAASSYVAEMLKHQRIHGIVSIGGSSGTSLASVVMREALPVGFPKLIVSTMASGNVKPFIEDTDISMMYSVVDIAGINSILSQILTNAAGAIDGMARTYQAATTAQAAAAGGAEQRQRSVAVTMFGVTTRCVDAIRLHLESQYKYEVYVFHATGSGGKTMERLIREGKIDGVIDVTTSEITDEVAGGVLTAGPDRLTAASKRGIPQIVCPGACELINFGPPDTIPARFEGREVYKHNPAVSLVRSNSSECRQVGEYISRNLRENVTNPDVVRVMVPEGGMSALSTPGDVFYDPEADSVLFAAIERGLQGSGVSVTRYPEPINNMEFAVRLADTLGSMMRKVAS